MVAPGQYDTEARPWHWKGVAPFRVEAARLGTNSRCVDCGLPPLSGGLRCRRCFSVLVGHRKRGKA